MKTICLVDGEIATSIPTDDRGLQYGDGLFETIAAPGGNIELLQEHLERLDSGAKKLGFAAIDLIALEGDVWQLVDPNEDQIIKIIVTRGSSSRGYSPAKNATTRRIVSTHAWPVRDQALPHDGIRAITCETRLPDDPLLAGIKSLNRVHQVLAAGEVAGSGDNEGIMLDATGRVVCGTMSNVFVVKNQNLKTPALERCGVAGVMRDQILRVAAKLGIDTDIGSVERTELADADEIFVTNSVIGLWPVGKLDGREQMVGPVAMNLRNVLFQSVLGRVSP